MTAEQLVVRLRFLPFLLGRIEIADVELVNPTITVAFDRNGTSNWTSHVDSLARALQPTGHPKKLMGGGPLWAIFDAAAVEREKWGTTTPHVDRAGGYFFSGRI